MLLVSVMVFSVSSAAEAGGLFNERYSIGVSAKVYYTDKAGDTKRMGSVSGKFYDGTDGRVHLFLGGREYPVKGGFIVVESKSNCSGDYLPEDRPSMRFVLDLKTVNDLMLAANDSIWRAASTKKHVANLIESAVKLFGKDLRFTGYYCAHTYLKDEDGREGTYKFVEPKSGETVTLVLKISRSLDIIDYGMRKGD